MKYLKGFKGYVESVKINDYSDFEYFYTKDKTKAIEGNLADEIVSLARQRDSHTPLWVERTVSNCKGDEIDYDAVVELMDSELYHDLVSRFSGVVTEQEFFEMYGVEHLKKFGKTFVPFTGGEA